MEEGKETNQVPISGETWRRRVKNRSFRGESSKKGGLGRRTSFNKSLREEERGAVLTFTGDSGKKNSLRRRPSERKLRCKIPSGSTGGKAERSEIVLCKWREVKENREGKNAQRREASQGGGKWEKTGKRRSEVSRSEHRASGKSRGGD